jgi:acyl carrier protein phosphodiesterase
MVSDFVKGAAKNNFPNDIRQGIELHRAIDSFTDLHPVTKKAKEIFRPAYRLYSGAIMDIIYDHFLARDPNQFSRETLQAFTQNVYAVLEEDSAYLPGQFVHVLYYMKIEDWLYQYQFEEAIQKSLKGLIRRAAYLSESETAYTLFLENYRALEEYYLEFFPDVKQYAKQRLKELLE